MNKFPIIKNKQASGLRTLLLPRSETESITFLVLIGVGSRYETLKQSGLSHFLEHMFFKGTETRPTTKEIAEAIDNIGGEFNAFTGEEFTGYYVKVAAANLETGADVVADILLKPLFPADEIERERGVIMEEMRMYTEMPMRHIQHLWLEALYGKHPLGRRIDGTPEAVSSLQRHHFKTYANKHYHGRNAVVAVAGNLNASKTDALLNKLFANMPKGQQTKPKPSPKKAPASRFVHEHRASLDQAHLIVGVPGLGLNHKYRFAAQLLATILGGGMSSRLFISIRERHGLAYAVRTSSEAFTDTGSFATQVGARTDKANVALKLILAEYNRVCEDFVTTSELTKAKEMARGHMLLELEETNSMAQFAGGQELLKNKILTPADLWQKYKAVTKEDIRKVARQLFSKDKLTLALLSPHKSVTAFDKLIR